jgi:hypothetical protein
MAATLTLLPVHRPGAGKLPTETRDGISQALIRDHAAYGSDRPAQALDVMGLMHLSQQREDGEYEPLRNCVTRAKALRARAKRIAMGLRQEFCDVL